jgi:hypothetical protein
MKRVYLIIIIIIVVLSGLSCKKYEDGPLISLRSKKARLLGKWKVVELLKDDENLTKFYQDSCGCDFEFVYDISQLNLDYKTYYVKINCLQNGWNFIIPDENLNIFYFTQSNWGFSKDGTEIYFQFGVNNDSRYRWGMYPLTVCNKCLNGFEVFRLTNKELWLRFDDLMNIYKIKFEKI